MAISTNGTIITRLAGALYNEYLSNASYTELNTTAAATVAANMLTNDFAGKTDAQLAKTILTNLGLTSIAGLDNYVAGQLTAAGSSAAAKGAKLVSMLNDYAMMTADATYGASATSFNAKTEASLVKSQTTGSKSGSFATSDVVAITNAVLPLTAGVDTTLVGGAGSDTYTATNATLTAGDSMDGGAGTDTLSLTSILGGTYGSGARSTGVENLSVTATIGDATVDASGLVGLTKITSVGSTQAVTVSGLTTIPSLELIGSSNNLTATMAAAAVIGAADSISVALNGAGTTALSTATVTANGVETINVASSGSASGSTSTSVTLASTAMTNLNVTGSVAARVAADLIGATALVTGTVTSDDGAHDVEILNADVADKLSVSMSAGNDTVRTGGISALHTIAGGDGTDTLRYSGATAVTLAATANVSGFETVTLSNAVANPSFAMTGAGVTTVNYTTAGAGTFGGLSTGGTVNLNVGGTVTVQAAGAAATATSTAATTAATYSGTADSLTVNVGLATTSTGVAASIVNALGVEAVTINSLTAAGGSEPRTVTFGDTTATTGATKSITVNSSGTGTITTVFSPTGTSALTSVNMAGVTGSAVFASGTTLVGVAITGGASHDTLTGGAAADTILGGEGNDVLGGGAGADSIDAGNGTNTITGSTGADTMTGGTGVDTYVFASNQTTAATAVVTSTTSATDTITNFTSGTDKISITGTYAPTKFLGNFTSIQAALSEQAGSNGLAFAAAYVTSENTLYVFQNTTGLLHVDDLAVKMTSVATLASSDFFLGSITGGNSITLTGTAGGSLTTAASTFATANIAETTAGTNTPAGSVLTTTANDTITANVLAIPNATTTLTGGTGTDTLALSMTAGNAAYTLPGTVTEFEAITLANMAATSAATNVFSVTLSANNVAANTTLAVTNNHIGTAFDGTLTAGGTVFVGTNALSDSTRRLNYTGSTGHDDVTGGAGNDTISGGDGNDTLVGAAGNDSLSGGAGNDTFTLSTNLTSADVILGSTGIADTLTFTNPAAVLVTQLDNVTGVEVFTYTGSTSGDGTTQLALNSLTPTALSSFATDTAARVITLANAVAATVNFSNVTAGTISFVGSTSTEYVTGSALADTITGTTGADTILSGLGNDTITVGTGAVSINAGGGDDTINMVLSIGVTDTIIGGDGSDTLTYTASGSVSDLDNVSGVETIVYGTSTATVTISVTISDAGVFDADTTSVTVSPRDVTDADKIAWSAENLTRAITITGGAGADTITGGAGADSLTGNAGTDTLIGGAGNDTLNGGDAADAYTPSTGNDTLILTDVTTAIDTIRYNEGGAANVDTVTGFTVGQDLIQINEAALTLAGSLLTNPTLSGTSGVDIASDTTQVFVTVAANAAVTAAGVNGVLKFTTGATSIAGAIGTGTVTLLNITGVETILGVWYDTGTSQAVVVGISPGADGTLLNVSGSDIFVEIVRIGMTSGDYSLLAIGTLTIAT